MRSPVQIWSAAPIFKPEIERFPAYFINFHNLLHAFSILTKDLGFEKPKQKPKPSPRNSFGFIKMRNQRLYKPVDFS